MSDQRSIREIYDTAGFGSGLGFGRRPALVVVDLTRGFTEAAFPTGADLSGVVEQTAELVEHAHRQGVPVVFTVLEFSDADVDTLVWLRKAPGLSILRTGSDAVALDPRLPRARGDLVISKVAASAFCGTHLASLLTSSRVDTVIACGATTSGCLRATVVDSIQAGFAPVVPIQCVGDRAVPPHEAALFDLQEKYADVVDVAVVSDYLQSLPAPAPVFAQPGPA
ncbi:MAG TPA: isochorismatase family protein [Mycobacteriales bacterium]|nr:isochorismatase family protein [Mycobacteriales bacterium]